MTTIDNTTKVQISLVGGLFAAALWCVTLINGIDVRQTRMEERAIAAADMLDLRLFTMGIDIGNISDNLQTGTQARDLMLERLRIIEQRVSEMENKQ